MTPDSPHEPHPLAVLAHELRTPLNAVLGYADAMRSDVFGPLPAPYKEQAALIHAAASHLLALVDAMTATHAAEAGDGPRGAEHPLAVGRPLDMKRTGGAAVERLLAEAVGLLSPRARASNLELRAVVTDPVAIQIRVDHIALSQILINLIDNALKFTAPGGTVAITVDRTNGDVRLAVEDGGGAGAAAGRVGSGLGLRLVRALSVAMGGTFRVDFPSGGHARAIVRLPAIMED